MTFRLETSDPDFLFKLAVPFAYVVPTGTTLNEAVRRPLPATGPYRIASVSGRSSLRLVRNPHFREWSSAAQPAGYPDEIVMRALASSEQRARLVAKNEADHTSTAFTRPFAVAPVDRPRLHVQPLLGTFYLALDTTRPPFDDVRARRALNFAVDRGRIIQLGRGPGSAEPTCQVLPPNFPGYKQYCPYTLHPGPAASWTAPDLARARRLTAASGTRGAEVVLWWHSEFGERPGRYLEHVLDSLGYHARLRLFSGDIGRYFSAVNARGAWHVFASGWMADYPAASNFLNLLSCSSASNFGHFCDSTVDAKIQRALRLQETDSAAANRSWAKVDRELTDRAAWVALHNELAGDFVSNRVGNYQRHPLWGALLAQLWVR